MTEQQPNFDKLQQSQQNQSQRKFRACLFDMDGLLINSEQIYTDISSKVLREKFNIEKGLTWDVKSQMQGLPGSKATQKMVDCYGLNDKTTGEELYKITSEMQTDYWPTCQLMPGVAELIKYLHDKGIPICVCTSTSKTKFPLKTSHLQDTFKLFDGNVITGDHESIVGKGKPLPFIWWLGVDKLNESLKKEGKPGNIKPEECLIFEDAVSGFISGKRAQGYVIWVPNENNLKVIGEQKVKEMVGANNEFGCVLNSLKDFEPTKYGF
ncbi:unnamed protein product [Ambrosiozyma monospora]|uniref:Unnamed protein product n=1 Tax=Ambrosiozyma monospora TaxID=43982 RepID=A0ACB5T8Q5_AMBMO|nr:unnamed protein product [Ambrosiozyma monospora]